MMATQNVSSVGARDDLHRLFHVFAHDARGPLFSVEGFSELVLDGYGDALDVRGREMLSNIRNAIGQLREMFDAMTRASELLAQPERPEPITLGLLVAGVETVSLGYGGGPVEIDGDEGVHARLKVDASRCREGLGLLAGIASRDGAVARQLRCTIRCAERGSILITLDVPGTNGSQLPARNRAGAGSSEMWIARCLLESQGWSVQTDSGSAFVIEIPASGSREQVPS